VLKTNKVTVIIYSLTCCEASGLAAIDSFSSRSTVITKLISILSPYFYQNLKHTILYTHKFILISGVLS